MQRHAGAIAFHVPAVPEPGIQTAIELAIVDLHLFGGQELTEDQEAERLEMPKLLIG